MMNAYIPPIPRIFLTVLILLLAVAECCIAAPDGEPGETKTAGPGTGHWRNYDVTDGLTNGSVRAMFQDREGYLWFGTNGGGVSRFDGQTFTTFTKEDGLTDNRVSVIVQDRNGNLWFGTGGGGASRFDGHNWRTFTYKDGLASNSIRSGLLDREGNLWFGTHYGASRYDGHTFTSFTKENRLPEPWEFYVESMVQDREGNFWFGTRKEGVIRYDGSTWTPFTVKDGLPDNRVRSILQDREGNLWFGTRYGGVSRYDGQTWTTFTTENGLVSNSVGTILQDREGNLWFGTSGGVSRYDGQTWTTFTTENGLIDIGVQKALQDREGNLWFSTNAGVSRYDQTFTTFTTKDGLPDNVVVSIAQDQQENLWFGTAGGATQYNGRTFTTFTTKDGLPDNVVVSIAQDQQENLWFGTQDGGASRFDGQTFTTFTMKDGLPANLVATIRQDQEGNLWFGGSYHGGGVSRYDGRTWTNFTTEDGLAHRFVGSIFQDREKILWFGTGGNAVSTYDGQRIASYILKKGASGGSVLSILQDEEGNLWFSSTESGVSRFDGETFTAFTVKDGLASNSVGSSLKDRNGHLWFGTVGGGVSRFDGQTFQTWTHQDGLGSNRVRSIFQDREGHIWFGTNNGVTVYRPSPSLSPPVFIEGVVADRRYQKIRKLSIPSTVGLVTFEFHGMSFKTRRDGLIYRYRLRGLDDWRTTTARKVEYEDLPWGTYTFEVQAVDRDLVYSAAPASVLLTVHPPYERSGFLVALGIAIALVVWQTVRVVRRDRQLKETQARLIEEMEKELQAARDMQMELLPEAPPRLDGMELAGTCIPARQVGGDYYTFLESPEEDDPKIGIAVADVSGKGMQAATVAMRFNEMLLYEATGKTSGQEILKGLDGSLRGRIRPEMFVTCGIGLLDPAQRSLTFDSAACPEVYHFIGAEKAVRTLGATGFPLGLPLVLEGDLFQRVEINLSPGDIIVFTSDGVEEAQDEQGEFYGQERLIDLLQACGKKGMSAGAIRDEVVDDVVRFTGDAPQTDDLTVVVLRVE